MSLEFFIPMDIPTTTHNDLVPRKNRNGKLFIGKSDKLKAAEQCWTLMLKRHAPKEPIKGAVRIRVVFNFKAKGKHKPGDPHTNKPDSDNLIKTVFDVLATLGYFTNDAHVAYYETAKVYSDCEGVYIKMEEIS